MADNSTDDMIIAIGVDLATIRRGLKKLEQEVGTSTGRVQKQFETVGRGIDNAMTTAMQNRINAMVGVGTKGAKEWTGALADQGKELERLRAKYSPLFATINNYKAAVADIRRAHAVGAISANEMTAALSQQRQEALKSIATIKARNSALSDTPAMHGARGFQTANIAAQFQDIAVTSAMGMSPLQIALQQGTQLSAVLGTMGSGKQVIAGLGAAFASLVSPVSLVTIGLIAGGAALAQYITGAGNVKTADDAIKSHADTIASIKDAYGEAAEGLGGYVKKSQAEAAAAARENLKVQQDVAKAATSEFNKLLGVLQARTGGASDVATRFRPFTEAIREFRQSVAEGSPDFVRLRSEIEAIVATNPEGLRRLADEIINGSVAAADADRRVRSAKDVIAGLGKIALEQTGGIGSLTNALQELADIAVPAMSDAERALAAYRKAVQSAQGAEDRRAASKAYDDARRRIDDANPTINNADGKRVAVPVPGDKPSPLDGDGKELKKQETAAQKAANAYRDLIKSANDRIGQLQLEVEITGQYGVATDAARFRLELLQQAEDKGRSLNTKQRAEIEQKVALYEKYSQALAETKLQQDLMNQARFSSLSKQDQQVVTTLRQYGLSEDLGGKNAQAIRQSLQGQEISDGFKSFAMQFSTGLISEGKSLGEAFGDAVKTAAASAMQKSLESLFSQIGNALASALMPKLGGGASPFTATTTLGDLLGAGAAPVGAVTRSALPALGSQSGNMTAYMQAIKDIESSGGNYGALGPITRNGDRGHGAYQVMGNNIGPWSKEALGRSISADEFLKNPALQDQIFAHKFGGYVDKFGPSGAAQAWFGGPGSVGKGGLGQDMLGTSGNAYVKMFETNVAKMGNVAGEATKGIGAMNGGLQAIAQNFGAAGGGINLGGLFSSSFKPNTTLSNFINGIPGFDGGGHTGAGTRTGGLDGKGGFLALMHPRETVTDHTKINAPRAPRLNPSGGPRVVRNESALTVQIQGANGDDHVRML
ncbi:phage tail length tape measure family protein, partial [Shinella sp. M31]|uniref:phage tail length tape measure family protein n=1 Tax=Shinella sp. M31 TaxID=3368615 RepID=UPI003B9F659D